MDTSSPAISKQSRSPQHSSPAAFRYPPRWIHSAGPCALASDSVAAMRMAESVTRVTDLRDKFMTPLHFCGYQAAPRNANNPLTIVFVNDPLTVLEGDSGAANTRINTYFQLVMAVLRALCARRHARSVKRRGQPAPPRTDARRSAARAVHGCARFPPARVPR